MATFKNKFPASVIDYIIDAGSLNKRIDTVLKWETQKTLLDASKKFGQNVNQKKIKSKKECRINYNLEIAKNPPKMYPRQVQILRHY